MCGSVARAGDHKCVRPSQNTYEPIQMYKSGYGFVLNCDFNG